mmetsp:Transcript_6063/g.12029  ORF Transcript_6063/g.12029 Transcript_6063/m.12029 type:complete len:211 (-) Transcript_6063:220-852(-)
MFGMRRSSFGIKFLAPASQSRQTRGAPESLDSQTQSRADRNGSGKTCGGVHLEGGDDLVLHRPHLLEPPLVVLVTVGCLEPLVHPAHLRKRLHDVEPLGLELLEAGRPPVHVLQQEEIHGRGLLAKVVRPLNGALNVRHQSLPAAPRQEGLERGAVLVILAKAVLESVDDVCTELHRLEDVVVGRREPQLVAKVEARGDRLANLDVAVDE